MVQKVAVINATGHQEWADAAPVEVIPVADLAPVVAPLITHDSLGSISSDQHHAKLHATSHLSGGNDPIFAETVPTTAAFGDTAAQGADATKVAKLLHRHGMPANPVIAHEAASDPHTGYRLESADHTHASSGLQAGQIAYSSLTGTPAAERAAATAAPPAIGTAAVGVAVKDAREDHVHATGAGTPSTQAFGDAAAVGSGPAASMTDHKHAMPANPFVLGTAPSTQAFGDAAAGGAATDAAKTDHKHGFPALGTTPSTQAFADAAAGGSATTPSKNDHKHAMPTLGYGLSGNSAPAVGLSQASAFATATTSVSAATYADVTGVSISLAAGTWLIIANCYGSSVNAQAIMHVAITDAANAIVAEGSQGIGASGTASVAQLGNCTVAAIVSPGSTTTYKLRAARGLTTITGTWVAMDGAGTNTTNNLTDNSDKGTGIFAIRIA